MCPSPWVMKQFAAVGPEVEIALGSQPPMSRVVYVDNCNITEHLHNEGGTQHITMKKKIIKRRLTKSIKYLKT